MFTPPGLSHAFGAGSDQSVLSLVLYLAEGGDPAVFEADGQRVTGQHADAAPAEILDRKAPVGRVLDPARPRHAFEPLGLRVEPDDVALDRITPAGAAAPVLDRRGAGAVLPRGPAQRVAPVRIESETRADDLLPAALPGAGEYRRDLVIYRLQPIGADDTGGDCRRRARRGRFYGTASTGLPAQAARRSGSKYAAATTLMNGSLGSEGR